MSNIQSSFINLNQTIKGKKGIGNVSEKGKGPLADDITKFLGFNELEFNNFKFEIHHRISSWNLSQINLSIHKLPI